MKPIEHNPNSRTPEKPTERTPEQLAEEYVNTYHSADQRWAASRGFLAGHSAASESARETIERLTRERQGAIDELRKETELTARLTRERDEWKQWQENTRQGGQILAAERDTLQSDLVKVREEIERLKELLAADTFIYLFMTENGKGWEIYDSNADRGEAFEAAHVNEALGLAEEQAKLWSKITSQPIKVCVPPHLELKKQITTLRAELSAAREEERSAVSSWRKVVQERDNRIAEVNSLQTLLSAANARAEKAELNRLITAEEVENWRKAWYQERENHLKQRDELRQKLAEREDAISSTATKGGKENA